MEEKYFTIEEAASILRCSRWTVRRLLAKGWLRPPGGRPKGDESGKVSEKSLFQLIVLDAASGLPARTLKALKKGRKVFETFLVQTPNANCLSINEGEGQAPEIPAAGFKPQENNDARVRCLHHDTAAEHQFSFGWLARRLAPGDPALQDDLVQEMSLAVLEYEKEASFEFLFELAANRAKNYLEYEAARGMLPLSEAREISDSFTEKMENLNHLIDQLMQRGVPKDWIEEVLGRRLEVA